MSSEESSVVAAQTVGDVWPPPRSYHTSTLIIVSETSWKLYVIGGKGKIDIEEQVYELKISLTDEPSRPGTGNTEAVKLKSYEISKDGKTKKVYSKSVPKMEWRLLDFADNESAIYHLPSDRPAARYMYPPHPHPPPPPNIAERCCSVARRSPFLPPLLILHLLQTSPSDAAASLATQPSSSPSASSSSSKHRRAIHAPSDAAEADLSPAMSPSAPSPRAPPPLLGVMCSQVGAWCVCVFLCCHPSLASIASASFASCACAYTSLPVSGPLPPSPRSHPLPIPPACERRRGRHSGGE